MFLRATHRLNEAVNNNKLVYLNGVMIYIIWILSILNIYLGLKNFLNVIHVLQNSKYSKSATALFAILFLGMGIMGLFCSLVKNNYKLALVVEIGPWILALLFLLFSMMTSDYK